MLSRAQDNSAPSKNLNLNAGDWVEVRSREEILATLDENGCLENLPFMPEMFAFCGRRLRVYKRAHKTCDTVNDYKGRRMKDAVHLEGVRCDGQGHGGCEASCLIYWKTAWLRKCDQTDSASKPLPNLAREERKGETHCTEADVLAFARKDPVNGGAPAYVCQATQVPAATEPLPWSEWRQYVEDYSSGNVTLVRMAKSFVYMAYVHGLVNLGIGVGPFLRWTYDMFQGFRRGVPFPRRTGKLVAGTRTPSTSLDLRPGEWVRVKSLEAIRSTCDESNANRGLRWDAEMVPYCGGTYQVLKRVSKIINEKTGKMQEMKAPCIILDSVVCQARYSDCRLFCPRSIYPYWREIWLERIGSDASQEMHG
jgi:hypothetical protein